MAEARNPLEAALDLFLYAPVGLAITAAEELPRMAAKGRSRVTSQLTMARVVGQFAVSRGRSELERRLGPRPAVRAGGPVPAPADAPSEPALDFEEMTGQATNGSAASAYADVVAATPTSVDDPGGDRPSADGLAIPGYDSLSASQVVQRLAGLEHPELDAVAAYERSHRGRRTVLNRIDQLQGR